MAGKHKRNLFRKVHREGVHALSDDELRTWLSDRRDRAADETGELRKLPDKDVYAAEREFARRSDG